MHLGVRLAPQRLQMIAVELVGRAERPTYGRRDGRESFLTRRSLGRQHGLHEFSLLRREERCEVLLHVLAPEHAHLMKEAISDHQRQSACPHMHHHLRDLVDERCHQ